ncbi:MAG: hypothetical protein J5534_04650 [Fibrobacter sp.]|nr:hypothetical protein [Fibrobacter sp.]
MKSLLRKFARKIWRRIKRSNGYASYWSGVAKFWDVSDFNYKVINLGSGTAVHAFNYGKRKNCMNWAMAPQSLAHDFCILKNYFSFLAEGAVVLIPLCPFSCLVSKYSKEQNLKYYTFLHPATVFDFDEQERIKALTKKNLGRKVIIKHVLKTFLADKKIEFKRLIKPFNYKKNALWWVNGWKKQFSIDDLDAPLSEKHAEEQKNRQNLLREIVSFCLERNLKPVFVMPPMHRELRALFSETFVKNYIDNFITPVLKSPVEFWNYSADELFDSDKYFDSALYMSKKGAVLFTNTLIARLQEAGMANGLDY